MLSTILILVAFGVALLVTEFVVPGGIIGVLGAIALVAAVVLAFIDYGPAVGGVAALAVLTTVIVFVGLWMKYVQRTWFGKKLTLETKVSGSQVEEITAGLRGRTGVAANDLRPSGTALIDGRRIDVVAEVGLIEKGRPVEVIKVEGIRVVVRECEEAGAAGS
jgi:membrane-bound ClpP family serine protease